MILYLIEIAAGFALILYSLWPCLRAGGLAAVFRGSLTGEDKQDKNTFSGTVITVFLLGLFLFLITYIVTEIPVAYNVDEAATAYDALNLIRYGVDRWLYKNPVYFINFGGGQNALYNYLAVLTVRIFGYSILSIRMPAVILSFVSALCFVFTIRKEYGGRASAIAAGLFCCLPFSIMHSRWGLESYLLFHLNSYFFLKYI